MADSFYNTGLAGLGLGTIDWVNDTIRIGLVSAFEYRFDETHEWADALGAGLLGWGTVVSPVDDGMGTVSCGTVTITAARSAQTAHAIVTYQWLGDLASSKLISYHDSVLGLPAAPDGNPFTLVVPWGPNRLFNYLTREFGVWEGLRGSFQSVLATPPCEGSVSWSQTR